MYNILESSNKQQSAVLSDLQIADIQWLIDQGNCPRTIPGYGTHRLQVPNLYPKLLEFLIKIIENDLGGDGVRIINTSLH